MATTTHRLDPPTSSSPPSPAVGGSGRFATSTPSMGQGSRGTSSARLASSSLGDRGCPPRWQPRLPPRLAPGRDARAATVAAGGAGAGRAQGPPNWRPRRSSDEPSECPPWSHPREPPSPGAPASSGGATGRSCGRCPRRLRHARPEASARDQRVGGDPLYRLSVVSFPPPRSTTTRARDACLSLISTGCLSRGTPRSPCAFQEPATVPSTMPAPPHPPW